MKRLLALAALSLSPLLMAAEDAKPSKLAVYLNQQCSDDSVGQRLAFRIKEELSTSTSMTAADSYDASVVQVSLVCLNPTIQESGSVSRYSYQVTLLNLKGFYDFALTHGVGACGGQRVAECAEGIVANIDQAVSELRVRIKNGSFKWPN